MYLTLCRIYEETHLRYKEEEIERVGMSELPHPMEVLVPLNFGIYLIDNCEPIFITSDLEFHQAVLSFCFGPHGYVYSGDRSVLVAWRCKTLPGVRMDTS